MRYLDKEVPLIDKVDDELIDIATEDMELEEDIILEEEDEDEDSYILEDTEDVEG